MAYYYVPLMISYWRRVDGRLIRRGEIILDLESVKGYSDELREINDGKRGRPYKITDRGPPSRRSSARMIRDMGYDIWRRVVGYGRRWMAETAISIFKSTFGEEILSNKPRWINIEIIQKAFVYNLLLNTT